MIQRIAEIAAVTPTHSIAAAINAADDKAGEPSRNLQNSANMAISTHANATSMNLCNWSAFALSLAMVTNNTKIANQQSQDAAPM